MSVKRAYGQRVSKFLHNGDYESQDEQEEGQNKSEEVAYQDTGELLMIKRALSVLIDP